MRPLNGALIFGPNRRRFKRAKTTLSLFGHEFVIEPSGNRRPSETYWLQEPKSSDGQAALPPDRPDLIACLEIFG
jgi:hypothetical protein